ncbi:MAG TPA: hypothetical protein VIL46_05455 [Gemmataceae bacterium]
MGKTFGDLGADEEDAPPQPDTSEPAGEKAVEMLDALEEARRQLSSHLPGIMDQLIAERAAGSWGRGESALELAQRSEKGRTIVAELEAYAAARKKR